MNIMLIMGGRVPTRLYGGTERVVWYLARELHAMGHKVKLLAAPGSSCPWADVGVFDPAVPIDRQVGRETDIVHMHISPPLVKDWEVTVPHVITFHGNELYGTEDRNTIFVSANHAARFGCEAFVYNGMDWDSYGRADLGLARRGYSFLGKAAWRVKNLKGAMEVARRAGAALDVMGGSRLNMKMGFRLTLDPRIRFHGMVGDAEKGRLLSRSQGLLFPVTWHEPFGLSVVEALYFGAPVFATPYGSLPELVTPEVGALSTSADEMVRSMAEARFEPARCHEYARDMFNSRRMAEGYVSMYERVIDGEWLNECSPVQAMPYRGLPWER